MHMTKYLGSSSSAGVESIALLGARSIIAPPVRHSNNLASAKEQENQEHVELEHPISNRRVKIVSDCHAGETTR